MADLLTYAVSAAPPVDADVVRREMSVVVNGEVVENKVFEPTAVDLGTVTVVQDSNVELVLVDVDDADNTSPPASVSFLATDTLPPAAPGSFGVTLVSETPADTVSTEEKNDDGVDQA